MFSFCRCEEPAPLDSVAALEVYGRPTLEEPEDASGQEDIVQLPVSFVVNEHAKLRPEPPMISAACVVFAVPSARAVSAEGFEGHIVNLHQWFPHSRFVGMRNLNERWLGLLLPWYRPVVSMTQRWMNVWQIYGCSKFRPSPRCFVPFRSI